MENVKRPIAGEIRRVLREMGMTQRDLGELLGWNDQKVSRILRNQQGLSAENMADICEAMDKPYDYFVKLARGGVYVESARE